MPQLRGVDGAVVSEDHIPLLQYCLVRHLVDLVECKSVWVVGPEFADGFVGCEAAKGLESPSEVVGCDEVRQVCSELFSVSPGALAYINFPS
jgi:hypothetical protein